MICEIKLLLFLISAMLICALMFITSNHYGIKCLSNLLQVEQCNVMFTVISDIMAHWYEMEIKLLLQLVSALGRK